jgi:hypothetical protein
VHGLATGIEKNSTFRDCCVMLTVPAPASAAVEEHRTNSATNPATPTERFNILNPPRFVASPEQRGQL